LGGCTVECGLPEEDVILKEPLPMNPPLRGGRVGGGDQGVLGPPRTPLLSDLLTGAYFFSKTENAIFKILLDCPFWRADF